MEYGPNEMEEEYNKCINSFIQEFENMKICSENNINSVKCYNVL